MGNKKGFGRERLRPARFIAALLAAMIWSCPYIAFKDSMRDPSYNGHPKKILIHVVDRSPIVSSSHPAIGGVLEDQLVELLEERGVAALAAYKFLSDVPVINGNEIERIVREKGADSVFIAGPTNRKNLETLGPQDISYASGLLEGRIEDPDRFSAFVKGSLNFSGIYAGKKIFMELVLYDVKQNRRIWSALAKTRIWDAPEDAVRPIAARIMESLTAEKIIP